MALRRLLIVLLAVGFVGVFPARAEVPNDDYATAEVFTDLPFNTHVDTTEATTEPHVRSPLGEPCGWGMQRSVWYRFEPAKDTQTSVSALGSGFDAALAVFVGDDRSSLRGIACTSGIDQRPAEIDLGVKAGVTYSIVVGGHGSFRGDDAFGELDLSVTEVDGPIRYRPPLNDGRSEATAIEALPFQDTVYVHSADHDYDDPGAMGLPLGALDDVGNSGNVWYRFTPDEDTTLRITAERRYPNLYFLLYEEAAEGRLRFVARGGEFYNSRIIATRVTAGHSYVIEVTATFEEDDDPVHITVESPPPSDLVIDWVTVTKDDLGFHSIAFGWHFEGPFSGAEWLIEGCPIPPTTEGCSRLASGTAMGFLDRSATSGPVLSCIGRVDVRVTAIGLYADPNLNNNVRRERAAMTGGEAGLDAGMCAPMSFDLDQPLLP